MAMNNFIKRILLLIKSERNWRERMNCTPKPFKSYCAKMSERLEIKVTGRDLKGEQSDLRN